MSIGCNIREHYYGYISSVFAGTKEDNIRMSFLVLIMSHFLYLYLKLLIILHNNVYTDITGR